MIVAKKQLSLGEQLDAKYAKIRDNQDANKQLKAEARALYCDPITPSEVIRVELDRLRAKKRRLEREQKQIAKDINEQQKALFESYDGKVWVR